MVEVPSVITGAFELQDVSVTYGSETAVAGVSMRIPSQAVTALIGPSGCGKSTLLRCLNRMNDELGNVKVGGRILLDGVNVNDKSVDPVELRMRVGQVFQKPNPVPDVDLRQRLLRTAHPRHPRARRARRARRGVAEARGPVEGGQGLRSRSTRSSSPAASSSGCASRARLATEPEVLLMDEPASALDPISTQQIEDTIAELKDSVTVVIVTHNMQQAARISDQTAFMLRDSMERPAALIEMGDTKTMFTNPADKRTEAYITGRFG